MVTDNKNYENFLSDPQIKIEAKSITHIGDSIAADALTEYDCIVINYKLELGLKGDRLWQLNNFLNKGNNLFIFILNRHYTANNQSSSQLIGDIVKYIGIDPAQFILHNPSGG